jgi:hypothetical protein
LFPQNANIGIRNSPSIGPIVRTLSCSPAAGVSLIFNPAPDAYYVVENNQILSLQLTKRARGIEEFGSSINKRLYCYLQTSNNKAE